MAKETVLSNLNILTFKTQKGFQNHVDEIGEFDMAFTPDQSLKGNLFDFKWADHILNDISWLRADTFSWHSGDVYVAAYEHLAGDLPETETVQMYCWQGGDGAMYSEFYTKTETPDTSTEVFYMDGGELRSEGTDEIDEVGNGYFETVGGVTYTRYQAGDITVQMSAETRTETASGITITYYQAEDGHKICLPDQEANVSALYEQTGSADYYLLDTANKQFKLPRKYRPKRELVRSAKNYDGAWYNLYSDGWVEQGGLSSVTATTSDTITLPIEMSDTNYTVMSGLKRTTNTGSGHSSVGGRPVSTTQIKLTGDYNDSGGASSMQGAYWQVCGYAAQVPAIKGNAFEYYYVGYFEQDAIEQTAGINAEMFNAKADVNLMNTASNVDIVIESQLPTADNGHTWYRKYKSGWVEQGGIYTGQTSGPTITLPVVMNGADYSVQALIKWASTDNVANTVRVKSASNSTVVFKQANGTSAATFDFYWQVSGYAA